MSDFTYVENVAYANICAEEALGSRVVSVSGKVTSFSVVLFLNNFFQLNPGCLERDSLGHYFAGVSHH